MSSAADSPSPSPPPPSLEELTSRSATALLLPWILGMAAASDSSPREVAVFVHQPTRSITLIDGSPDIESLLPSKDDGHPPASKSSVEALPLVGVTEPGSECVICLTEYGVNAEAKEMPCGHRFHCDCVDRWLGLHGSCPVCRFSMPVEEEEEESGEMSGWRIHVFVSRVRRDSDEESGEEEEGDDDDDGNDEVADQEEMEIDDSD